MGNSNGGYSPSNYSKFHDPNVFHQVNTAKTVDKIHQNYLQEQM